MTLFSSRLRMYLPLKLCRGSAAIYRTDTYTQRWRELYVSMVTQSFFATPQFSRAFFRLTILLCFRFQCITTERGDPWTRICNSRIPIPGTGALWVSDLLLSLVVSKFGRYLAIVPTSKSYVRKYNDYVTMYHSL